MTSFMNLDAQFEREKKILEWGISILLAVRGLGRLFFFGKMCSHTRCAQCGIDILPPGTCTLLNLLGARNH